MESRGISIDIGFPFLNSVDFNTNEGEFNLAIVAPPSLSVRQRVPFFQAKPACIRILSRELKQHCLGILRRTEQYLPGFFVPRWLQIPEYEQEWDRQWDRGPVRS